MKIKYLILCCFILNINDLYGNTQILNDFEVNRIVNAIYIIEGGAKTKYKYGIKSIKTNNPKQICINTVRNNTIRYKNQSKYTNYFEFLGSRYCPVEGDRTGLNKNWTGNLQKILGKDFVNSINNKLNNIFVP